MNKPNPIEYLDLGSNDLKQGVSSLFNVLSGNKTLRNLILSENKIDSNDLSEFITSIVFNF